MKGSLSRGAYNSGPTGNANFGYVMGGSPSEVSSVDRIDYSNDTATASPKGPLSIKKNQFESTGDINFGYAMGGGYPAPANGKIIDRVDYSNDTATALNRALLAYGRTEHSCYGAAESANPQ